MSRDCNVTQCCQFTVISNECEKSILQKNDRIKQDRPLTMKLFEVTVIQSPLNLTALSDVRGLSILKRCRFITRHIRRLAK